jgi:hypothetical protein
MTEKPHYNVAIATPGRMFHAEYVTSLVRTIRELESRGITYTFLNRYSSFVPTARELTVIDSAQHDYSNNLIAGGKFTCDKIFWIDSDIEWEPDDFLNLYLSELGIVSGLYALDGTGLVAAGKLDSEGIMKRMNSRELMFDDGPVVVGGVGFGFLCVRSEIWESVPRPWFLIGKMRWDESGMMVNVGEDYSWCGRAQTAGHQIYLDPTIRVKHHKEMVIAP